ncbi:hemolysin family protein [Desertivirga brevis]|uniref:hemolysin family protein n=1 Tax=Desertivirga brevis TaxID=2810310 RepID=UPI001A9606C5|nr:hemolysin family protein [Pedobacter sp. SYSU D00873]
MEILIIIVLILLNGIFSMSEIALASAKKFKLESMAKRGDAGARRALDLASNPNTFLSTVQIGITIIGILTGIFSGENLTSYAEVAISRVAFLKPYADTIALLVVVITITFFSILFGELLPKRIGLSFPEKVSSLVAGAMIIISKVTKPFIWLLSKSNDVFLRIFGIADNGVEVASEEEITSIIEESTQRGEIQEIEQRIVQRVFALGDRKVSELMTHRTDIIWFDVNDNLDTIRSRIRDYNHSVYPVAEKSLDNLRGVIDIKEIFVQEQINNMVSIEKLIKKPLYVHEHMAVYNLLEQLNGAGLDIAIVIDEYGSIEGMITMDDVITALVGGLPTTSAEGYQMSIRDENSWLADGQFSFYEMLRLLDITLEEDETRFSTLAGLILQHLNHIPIAGEKIEWKGFVFEIVDMDERRIDKVMIHKQSGNDAALDLGVFKT